MPMAERSKGQLSVELLAILGLMLALITPALFFAYTKSVEVSQGFTYEKGSETLERIAGMVEMVASSGEGSAVRARVEVPPSTELRTETYTGGTLLTLRMGSSSIVKVLPYTVVMKPIEGGIYTVVVENKGKYIEVRVE